MIAQQVPGIEADAIHSALADEWLRRPKTLAGEIPASFELSSAQADEWSGAWGTGGREVPLTFDDALQIVTAFLGPLLDGSANGEWHPAEQAWR